MADWPERDAPDDATDGLTDEPTLANTDGDVAGLDTDSGTGEPHTRSTTDLSGIDPDELELRPKTQADDDVQVVGKAGGGAVGTEDGDWGPGTAGGGCHSDQAIDEPVGNTSDVVLGDDERPGRTTGTPSADTGAPGTGDEAE